MDRKEEEGRGGKYGQENYEASGGRERYQAWIRELKGIRGDGRGWTYSLTRELRGIRGMGQGGSVHKGTERHDWGLTASSPGPQSR